ncbi:hypothetical protein [Arenicella sp. 4NH20-0111]
MTEMTCIGWPMATKLSLEQPDILNIDRERHDHRATFIAEPLS